MIMSVDVRTLLFAKIKCGNDDTYKNFFRGNQNNNYITIGNYDALKVYDVSCFFSAENGHDYLLAFQTEKDHLANMYAEYNNNPQFYHPLHIVYHGNRDTETFWKTERKCCSVILLYNGTDFSSITELEKNIDTLLSTKLPCENYMVYRSVNLSEIVVIIKNDKLTNILDSISVINYRYPMIQTHTVCGFNYNRNPKAEPDDVIDMLKITGVIKSHPKAKLVFDKLNHWLIKDKDSNVEIRRDYLAFGNNDFNLIYYDVNVESIIDALFYLINDSSNIHAAFSFIKTRVHTQYSKSEQFDEMMMENDLDINETHYYEQIKLFDNIIVDTIKNIKNCERIVNSNYLDWAFPFIETLNLLLDMNHNASLSRVSYYTIGPIIAFNKTLSEILSNSKEEIKSILQLNEESLNRFTSSFNTLIDQIVRVDGYFSQEPGFSPLIYTMVPAGILEYYCSYIYSVTDTINEMSDSIFVGLKHKPSRYYYSTLPLPVLENLVSFEAIIPRSEQKNRTSQVNLIEIPHKDLYNPRNLLFSITHEVMHFCGERIRCREKRYDCLLEFLALYLIHEFNLEEIADSAKKIFRDYIDSFISKDNHQFYSQYIDYIGTAIAKLYSDTRLKNDIYHMKIKSIGVESQYEIFKYINRVSSRKSLFEQLSGNGSAITYLFKECYADLMTVKLLNIDRTDYCVIIDTMSSEIKRCEVNDYNLMVDSLIELRKSLVCYTQFGYMKTKHSELNCVNKLCEIFYLKQKKCSYKFISQKMDELVAFMCNSGMADARYSYSEIFFDIDCIMTVLDYLSECSQEFDKCWKRNPNSIKMIIETRNAYYNGIDTKKLFCDEYCNFMYKTRCKIREKIKCN